MNFRTLAIQTMVDPPPLSSLYKEMTKANRSFWIVFVFDYIWSFFSGADLKNSFRSTLAILGYRKSTKLQLFDIYRSHRPVFSSFVGGLTTPVVSGNYYS